MQLAVDFFPFFHRTARLLDEDPTLYCISSWNDNGQVHPDTLHIAALS